MVKLIRLTGKLVTFVNKSCNDLSAVQDDSLSCCKFYFMKDILVFAVLALCPSLIAAQEILDGAYDFQTDPNKKYSLFIPSGYDAMEPQAVMLALHPFNTNRWDAHSWCDTLSTFAEENQLLLVCPDGGADGKIDDPIDTAFTSFLLDEVAQAYNVNSDQQYAIGFSWGGKTVYTYGLTHADWFEGFLVVGAAVVSSEVSSLVGLAQNKKFYVVHGSNDNPNTRFNPIIDLLEPSHCVETNLLQGVGHTIDFPNRNTILNDAFEYLRTENCNVVSKSEDVNHSADLLNQTVYQRGTFLQWTKMGIEGRFYIVDSMGRNYYSGEAVNVMVPETPGWYLLISTTGDTERFIVIN